MQHTGNQFSSSMTVETDKKGKRKWGQEWIGFVVRISVITVIVIVIWSHVGQLAIVHDNNMYPHMKDGDLVLTCSLTDIHRNDAVVYVSGKKRMLGRIVACEGDSVEIDENGFFRVNGMPPYENVFYDTKPYADGIAYPFIVPEGEYFIMNDMRENTSDSRMTGSVSGKEIIGSVVFLIRHRGF